MRCWTVELVSVVNKLGEVVVTFVYGKLEREWTLNNVPVSVYYVALITGASTCCKIDYGGL